MYLFTARPVLALSIFLLVFGIASATFADNGVRTVALSGQHAPGTESGVVFDLFGDRGVRTNLNSKGQVVFAAKLAGPGITTSNNQGVWTEGRGDGLALFARDGDPVPGTPDVSRPNFSGSALSNLQINDTGVTAVGHHFGFTNFWGDGGTDGIQLIAHSGAPIPGLENTFFGSLTDRSELNSHGRITIPARVDDRRALVVYDPVDGYRLLAETGGQAPGLPSGILLDPGFMNFLKGSETSSGRFSLVSQVVGPGVDGTNDTGAWVSDDSGLLQLIVRKGGQAPGLSAGIAIRTFSTAFNDKGNFMLIGRLAGSRIDSSNNQGIWLGSAGSEPQLVARNGDQAPGMIDGVKFGERHSFANYLDFNNRDQVAFMTRVSGTGITEANNSGIWFGDSDAGLNLVIHEGEQAPGMANGVVISEFLQPLDSTFFGNPRLLRTVRKISDDFPCEI